MTNMISQAENTNTVYRNLPTKELLNIALDRGEGRLAKNGALWWSAADYNRHAKEFIEAFITNFKKFKVSSEIIAAGPELI